MILKIFRQTKFSYLLRITHRKFSQSGFDSKLKKNTDMFTTEDDNLSFIESDFSSTSKDNNMLKKSYQKNDYEYQKDSIDSVEKNTHNSNRDIGESSTLNNNSFNKGKQLNKTEMDSIISKNKRKVVLIDNEQSNQIETNTHSQMNNNEISENQSKFSVTKNTRQMIDKPVMNDSVEDNDINLFFEKIKYRKNIELKKLEEDQRLLEYKWNRNERPKFINRWVKNNKID